MGDNKKRTIYDYKLKNWQIYFAIVMVVYFLISYTVYIVYSKTLGKYMLVSLLLFKIIEIFISKNKDVQKSVK
jgi:hypothetical protein